MYLAGRVAKEDYGFFAQLAINSLVSAWPVGESPTHRARVSLRENGLMDRNEHGGFDC